VDNRLLTRTLSGFFHTGLDRKKHLVVRVLFCEKRVMGFEPTNNGLGSRCLTTWRHPHEDNGHYSHVRDRCQGNLYYLYSFDLTASLAKDPSPYLPSLRVNPQCCAQFFQEETVIATEAISTEKDAQMVFSGGRQSNLLLLQPQRNRD
jgi:hypothetical protein